MLGEYLQRHWVRVLVSLLILGFFLAHVSKWAHWNLISRLESIAYDARLLFMMPGDASVDGRVVIVDIDEKSLAAEGRWPWPRNDIALLVDRLFTDYGAALVAFDVVFAEPEEASAVEALEILSEEGLFEEEAKRLRVEALKSSYRHDQILAERLKAHRELDHDVVLGVFFTSGDARAGGAGLAQKIGALPEPVFRSGQFTGRNIPFVSANGYAGNLPELQRWARGAGHLNSVPDVDGLVRRVPMLYEYEGNYYEALSLAIVRIVLGVDKLVPGFPTESRAGRTYSDLEWLRAGAARVPVDQGVSALVPFRGPQGSYPYVSATNVLRGTADHELLKGKIVLVGATAEGLLDLRATPVQADFPGVEIHANLITAMLDGELMENPAYTLGAEFLIVLGSGLAMALLLPVLSPVMAAALTLALLTGITALNLVIWQQGNIVFPLAASLLTVIGLFLFNMWYAYFFEARGKRQLAGLFGEYVPPELVEEMSQHPDSFTYESENRELTVLFSDVRSFTTISEALDPKELSELMNEYLTPMTRIIYDHRGTIDKYMGDAIMAFWGAPVYDENHARNALLAGMEMVARLESLGAEFRTRGWPRLHIGVGINTGDMNVGNMGSRFRRAYTVMGDAVNLASRLEGLTKTYGVSIIVSDATRDAVPDLAYREIDRVRVKGKDKPVTIYEPLGPPEEVDKSARDELRLYREGLRLYRAQNWDMAEIQFVNLHRRAPKSALYKVYARRITHFRKHPPPPDWDGVYTHLEK